MNKAPTQDNEKWIGKFFSQKVACPLYYGLEESRPYRI